MSDGRGRGEREGVRVSEGSTEGERGRVERGSEERKRKGDWDK